MENLLSAEDMSRYGEMIIAMVIEYTPDLLMAIIVLVLGLWIANRLVALMGRGMERSNAEPTLTRFLGSLLSIALKALVLITAAGMLGIETTSFIAVVGAAGLAVGLALQGSLANFAGGVLVLLFKPYRVGDYIAAEGVGGTVTEIQILSTILNTPDNTRIIVPNGVLSNGIITNYSTEPTRRVDFVFGIGYGDEISKARDIISRIIGDDPRTFDDPAPQIVVSSLADHAVEITVRVWAKNADYWGVKFDVTEQVKLAFDAEGITIPFPQRTIHVIREPA